MYISKGAELDLYWSEIEERGPFQRGLIKNEEFFVTGSVDSDIKVKIKILPHLD